MQVCQVNSCVNPTSFGRLNTVQKGTKVIVRELESCIGSSGGDKFYALYHGVVPKAKSPINLPPVVQAIRKYLAADFK